MMCYIEVVKDESIIKASSLLPRACTVRDRFYHKWMRSDIIWMNETEGQLHELQGGEGPFEGGEGGQKFVSIDAGW